MYIDNVRNDADVYPILGIDKSYGGASASNGECVCQEDKLKQRSLDICRDLSSQDLPISQ